MRPRPARFGHGDVVDVGWTQALFSYRGVARRRGPARASRHEEIVSEDWVGAFAAIEEEAGAAWMRRHLDHCLEPLLSER